MTIAAGAEAAVSPPCPACGTHVAASLLACPGCHRLVHADALKEHAARAEVAAREGDHHAALVAWRASLDLLRLDRASTRGWRNASRHCRKQQNSQARQ